MLLSSLIFLMYSTVANAGDMVTCKTQSSRWQAELKMNSRGSGTLDITDVHRKNKFSCTLAPSSLHDFSQGKIADYKLSMLVTHCDKVHSFLLSELSLTIRPRGKDYSNTKLHWLNNEKPETCKVSAIDISGLRLNAKLFQDGAWPARQPSSSEDKKLKTP